MKRDGLNYPLNSSADFITSILFKMTQVG